MGSLDNSAAASFVYAKASGLLSKAFVGSNASKLFSVQSLRELYTLLFDEELPSIPEVLLSKQIETKAEEKFINQYKNLIEEFNNPAAILSEIISFYEYENSEQSSPENDRDKILSLWNSVLALHGNDKENLTKLYKMEFSLKNILWAIRLKVFYKFTPEEILEHLIYTSPKPSKTDIFAKEALAIINKDINSYDDWKNWKYASLLNPSEDGNIWEIDPCWIEKSFKTYLAKKYYNFFHKDPMSITSFVAWFRIKQYELDCIRAVTEGLRLGIETEHVMNISGYSSFV